MHANNYNITVSGLIAVVVPAVPMSVAPVTGAIASGKPVQFIIIISSAQTPTGPIAFLQLTSHLHGTMLQIRSMYDLWKMQL